MPEHLIGLLLGTEDDWPRVFEALVAKLPPVEHGGQTHTFRTERITNEPFDLRARPRYELVIDRLGWWYEIAREWVKKAALMDDVYLLNNPFTFQAMEKHSAYCAMIRLGLKVPETWMVPHKVPTTVPRREYMLAEKFQHMATRYNLPFDLGGVAEQVGYPLYMKPFDGGQWVGVTRVANEDELHRQYDASGQRLMHLQAAVDGFDVFVRSLSIGAETMVMWFDPDAPMHLRYRVEHDFLEPKVGREVVTISRLVNAFFRWEFNSCESLVRGTGVHPIDYANASPDVALTSLHYYFPWAMQALVKWCVFCTVTGRLMPIDQDKRVYFDIGDRDDLSYEQKLEEYRRLADGYFQVEEYDDFCARSLPAVRELALDYFASPEFDALLVEEVRALFPAHEHEEMIARHRGLVGAWVGDQAKS
ncbi:MAG TPA: hypothetical protein VJT84_10265 [Gaiellaceae bacterium]|nr:hypothetical protein [Gaiellaceae bacterium]